MSRASPLFAVTIFLSAFLLFAVQPIAGRFLLPGFGGSSSVWTACMLFFQVLLLGGYLYAHWIGSLPPRTARTFHVALLAVSLFLLPLDARAQSWRPLDGQAPTLAVVLILAARTGLPYLLLSSTGPLVQRWFSFAHPGISPYTLYAVSNAASLLSLAVYPFAIEPWTSLRTQASAWSAGYALFAVVCAWLAFGTLRAANQETPNAEPEDSPTLRPSAVTILHWTALSACGSALLVATTNQMTQEVASIPFLWVLPLILYLAAFMIAFAGDRYYSRRWTGLAVAIAVPVACAVEASGLNVDIRYHISAYAAALVACCIALFSELAFSKPHPRWLTLFYLAISAGGAIGGLLVAVGAPLVFTAYTEFQIALSVACILTLAGWIRSGALRWGALDADWILGPALALALGAGTPFVSMFRKDDEKTLFAWRNFYGILRVSERSDTVATKYLLTHGRITHGFQYRDAEKSKWATTYYATDSAIGLAMEHHPRRRLAQPLCIGVVGLGTGTIAALGRSGDTIRFYEINPDVIMIARGHFSYLKDSAARIEVVEGDARLQLEREATNPTLPLLDILVVDAFSSDSIPTHLLTVESAQVYRQRLKPDGLLLLHISNRSLDLNPVARALSSRLGWTAARFDSEDDPSRGTYSTTWVLLTSNKSYLEDADIAKTITAWTAKDRTPIEWTDNYTSLWRVLDL